MLLPSVVVKRAVTFLHLIVHLLPVEEQRAMRM